MSAAVCTASTRKYPFIHMRIADHTVLDDVKERSNCQICNRSRKFFCYTCYIPVGKVHNLIPKVDLPIKIDIIKHKKEIDGKSTAVHAAILAPSKVSIYTFPDIPDYSKEEKVVLIYPSSSSITVSQLFGRKVRLMTENNYGMPKGFNMGTKLRRRVKEIIEEDMALDPKICDMKTYTFENLPIHRAVFIDSTWNQSVSIFKDSRINCMPRVVLQNRISQFWRHQRGSPRWYLATIEAIHQFLLEVHVNAWGLNPKYRGLENLEIASEFFEAIQLVDAEEYDVLHESPYNGQYDNILYFFANMYDLIHKYYDHNELKSYRRPI